MSGETIALVTANFGGFDGMKPLMNKNPRIHGFYYTDAETAASASNRARDGWDQIIVPNYPRHDFSPRLRARYFKHQIHRLDEVQGYRWLAWCDSSVWLRNPNFLMTWAETLDSAPGPLNHCMVVPSTARSTVQEEYEYIKGMIDSGDAYQSARYVNEKMGEQMAWFNKMGLNTQAPLFAGTIWMVENTELMQEAWNTWWDQNLRFGMMDQLSFSLVLAHYGIEPVRFNEDLFANDYWIVASHKTPHK